MLSNAENRKYTLSEINTYYVDLTCLDVVVLNKRPFWTVESSATMNVNNKNELPDGFINFYLLPGWAFEI